jgi:hypothetical protein
MRHPPGESRLEDRAEELPSTSRKPARRGFFRTKSFLRDRPILAMLLAVGAGALLALLLGPRVLSDP